MNFRSYLEQTEKLYYYRIKTVKVLDDAALDRIQKVIQKYDPVEMSSVKKTILQKNPLDFYSIQNAEVYIVDLVLGLPVSSYILQQELRYSLSVSEQELFVRNDNEPSELETSRLNSEKEFTEEAKEKGYVRDALLNNPDYPEMEKIDSTQLSGDVYNSRLLAYLKNVKDNRPEMRVDAASSLFKWLDYPNNEVTSSTKKVAEELKDITDTGNLDNNYTSTNRLYKTKTGEKIVLRQKPDSVRKN